MRASPEVVQEVVKLVKDWIEMGAGALDNPDEQVQALLGRAYRAEHWHRFLTAGEELEDDGFALKRLLDEVDSLGRQLRGEVASSVSKRTVSPSYIYRTLAGNRFSAQHGRRRESQRSLLGILEQQCTGRTHAHRCK